MAAWMLYLTALAAALWAVGWLAERGARQAGRPTRFVWLATMVLSVAPVAALTLGIATVGLAGAELPAGAARDSFPLVLNRLLLLGWAAASLAFVAGLRLSARTLRRNASSWRTAGAAGETVLVSSAIGPAVVGARRPRVVVPGRVLQWEARLQSLVVMHEREHVRARDHWLLMAALALLAVVPWCLPLWWQFHRLREAIESDCDARVVAATGAARDYAGVLLALAGRRDRHLSALPALAPGAVEVERRIRRIVGRRRGSARRGAGLLAAAAILGLVATSVVPRPIAPGFGLERIRRPPVDPMLFRPPPSVTVILGIAESEAQLPGERPR